MTWIPVLKLGLWNAWIMMLYVLLNPLILLVVDKMVGTGNFLKKMEAVRARKAEKITSNISTAILFAFGAYSDILPIKLGRFGSMQALRSTWWLSGCSSQPWLSPPLHRWVNLSPA